MRAFGRCVARAAYCKVGAPHFTFAAGLSPDVISGVYRFLQRSRPGFGQLEPMYSVTVILQLRVRGAPG